MGEPRMTAPARLDGADLIRAVATIGVVGIHAVQWPSMKTPADHTFWFDADLITRFAVPAFVILTGVVLGFQYVHRRPDSRFMGRRLRRSIVPWAVWAPLYLLFDRFFLGSYPSQDMLGWWLGGSGHLWFLLLIPQFYVVFLIWPRTRLWLWAGFWLVVQTALQIVRIGLAGDTAGNLFAQVVVWHGFQLFPFWIGYFATGMAAGAWLRQHPMPATTATRWLFFTLTGAGAAVLLGVGLASQHKGLRGTGAFLLPTLPLFVLPLLAWLLTLAPLAEARPRLNHLVRRLSDASLAIYIIHPLALKVFGSLFWYVLRLDVFPAILAIAAMITLSIAVTWWVTNLLNRTPLRVATGAVVRQAA